MADRNELHMLWYKRRPRLVIQLFIANLLALLPLLLAIVYALATLERHQERQQALLFSASDSTRVVVSLADQIKDVERAARQLVVLEDARFISVVREKLLQLDQLVAEAERSLAPQVARDLLQELAAVSQATRAVTARDQIGQNAESTDSGLAAQFDRAAQVIAELRSRNQHWLGAQMRELTRDQAQLEERLVLWALLALPLTLALAVIATMLISRPLQSLSRAMERLGVGNLQEPVDLHGPRDIVQLAERLDWLRQQLIEADTQKKSLMRNITHELKTPLAAINEASALLADGIAGPLTAQQERVVTILSNNVTVLRQMIEQLLFFNTLSLPNQPRIVRLKFPQMIEEWCARFEDLRSRKQITFALQGEPARVRADTHRLELVFTNLVSNAVKYSPRKGVITIAWRLRDGEFVLQVSDQGPGISEQEIQSIFEPLYRGTAAPDALAMPGSGMGLAIARECASQMGASIEVSSVQPHGARFSVRVPHVE